MTHVSESSEEEVYWFLRAIRLSTRWPGGLLGLLGAIVISTVILLEEFRNKLETAEFIAALVVGTVLALAGPLIIALTGTSVGKTAGELGVAHANKEAEKAKERTAKISAMAPEQSTSKRSTPVGNGEQQ